MRLSGIQQSAMAAGVGLLALGGASAMADDIVPAQLISCTANRADTANVSLNNIRFGVADTFAWASATVHLSMRDGTMREYVLHGRADPIDKQLRPNRTTPGFAYTGFACTVQHPAIVAVQNCRGSGARRTCEVGIDVWGARMAYSVSLTAERVKVREASALQ